MPQSPGKKFEEDLAKSTPKDWFVYRLKDSASSWANTSLSRFTPKNSCDFFLFTGCVLYGVECKSFLGKSMPYSNIKKNQLDDLLAMSVDNPINAQGIFILNFRDLNETYAINAFMVNALIQSGHRKSVSIDEARANGVLIQQKLKRVRYSYDLSVLEKQIKQHISTRTDIIDEAIETIKKCELVAPNVKRIRLYEALGALHSLKRGSR